MLSAWRDIIPSITSVVREHGWSFLFILPSRFFSYLYFLFFRRDTFNFMGHQLPYFYHLYNVTFRNERCVEIPIALFFLRGKGKVLEVGNVLSHYVDFPHDIVDKYEVAPEVVNEDVADWSSPERYDLIISLSTLEHVGWDEQLQDNGKILRAIKNLKNHLAPGGFLVVTMPLGYNTVLDQLVSQKRLGLAHQLFLRRYSRNNKWKETPVLDVSSVRYGSPYPSANAIVVGMHF